jgi:hypothetical protein
MEHAPHYQTMIIVVATVVVPVGLAGCGSRASRQTPAAPPPRAATLRPPHAILPTLAPAPGQPPPIGLTPPAIVVGIRPLPPAFGSPPPAQPIPPACPPGAGGSEPGARPSPTPVAPAPAATATTCARAGPTVPLAQPASMSGQAENRTR